MELEIWEVVDDHHLQGFTIIGPCLAILTIGVVFKVHSEKNGWTSGKDVGLVWEQFDFINQRHAGIELFLAFWSGHTVFKTYEFSCGATAD